MLTVERDCFSSAAFGLVAVLMIASQVNAYVRSRSVAQSADFIAENALTSIRLVGRMGMDVQRERILVERHIFEQDDATMRATEKEITAARADFDEAAKEYAPLAGEAGAWHRLEADVAQAKQPTDDALALSRTNSDIEARRTMSELDPAFTKIEHDVDDLVRINQRAADDAMASVRNLQGGARKFRMVVVGLMALLTLAIGVFVARLVSRRERDVERFAAQLQDRNGELDAFAGRVAHDLGGPLGTISLAAGQLAHEAPNAKSTIAILERGVTRMSTLITDLLTLSRIDAQPPDAVSETLAVASAVESDLASRVKDVNGTLHVEVEPAQVRCTEGLLREVLFNLGENAVKYRRHDVPLELAVTGRANHGYEFRISDNGSGMPADEASHAFEPFFRGKQMHSTPGTGLGLAIVKRVVEVSGGSVSIDSTVGRGTTVVVKLPLRVA